MAKKEGAAPNETPNLVRLRAQIDEIDAALLQLIAKRKDIALEIAKVKQSSGSSDDEQRLKEVLDRVQGKAKEVGLDESEMKSLWKSLIAYMIKEQMKKYPY